MLLQFRALEFILGFWMFLVSRALGLILGFYLLGC